MATRHQLHLRSRTLQTDSVDVSSNYTSHLLNETSTAHSQTTTVDDSLSTNGFALGWLCLFFLMMLMRSPTVDERHRRGAMIRQQAREMRRTQQLKDPDVSAELVGRSLTVQRIVGGSGGHWQLGDVEESIESTDDELSSALQDEDDAACVICLEAFEIGDIVTWSKNQSECCHVYHQDCLSQWLQAKHDDCPSCRAVILDYQDENSGEQEEDVDDESGLLVMMNGLVSRARQASYTLIGQNNDNTEPEPAEARLEAGHSLSSVTAKA